MPRRSLARGNGSSVGSTSGRKRAAELTEDGQRIRIEAKTFTAKHRDAQGIVFETATGCRDQDAARRVLADLERRAELVRAKIVTPTENAIAEHQTVPLVHC